MVRALTTICLLLLSLVLSAPTAADAQAPAAMLAPAAVPATAPNAAAFVGDWVLAAQGANGPATFALTVKTDAGKVVAEISSEMMPKQAVTDISIVGPALVLRYGFDYQGMAVPVAVTLAPANGKI